MDEEDRRFLCQIEWRSCPPLNGEVMATLIKLDGEAGDGEGFYIAGNLFKKLFVSSFFLKKNYE